MARLVACWASIGPVVAWHKCRNRSFTRCDLMANGIKKDLFHARVIVIKLKNVMC